MHTVCNPLKRVKLDQLVSIIIPFYNTNPKFMQEAIDSVLKQTYRHWELFLVDDGSVRESTEVAVNYAAQYGEKVHYLNHAGHKNNGASMTRQLGIKHAKGSYIALLDADDLWMPQKLEQQVSILEAHPDVAMLYGNTKYWYSWTGKAEDQERDFMPRLGINNNSIVSPPHLLPLFLEGKAAVPCTCSVIVRRWVVEHIGGFESAFPGMYDDQVFYAKICLSAPVFVSSVCWDLYRQHSDSCCAVAQETSQNQVARLRFLNWLKTYMNEQEVFDADVWRALHRQLWLSQLPKLPIQIKWVDRWIQRGRRIWLRFEDAFLPHSLCNWLWRGF